MADDVVVIIESPEDQEIIVGGPETPDVEVILSDTGLPGAQGEPGPQGPMGLTGDVIHFSHKDLLQIGTGIFQVPIHEGSYQLDSVMVRVTSPADGASIIVDVCKNGTTIYTNPANRPTIAPGENAAVAGLPGVIFFGTGDYLRVDVVNVGSIYPGANLIVSIRLIKIA